MNNDEGWRQLLREAGRLEQAGQWAPARLGYKRLLATKPDLPDSWYNLARLERRLGDPRAALACYQRALDLRVTKPEEVRLNRAVILAEDMRQYIEAELELRQALQLNPQYLPALLNLENLCEDLGRRDDARRLCEQILALVPDQAAALARLANLHRFTRVDDPLIERLRQALGKPEMHPAEPASLGFALGRALDECGSHDEAFAEYARANRYSALAAADSDPLYVPAEHSAFIDRLIAAFPAAEPAAAAGAVAAAPTFIVGMFRSGSTLLEQLMSGHPQVAAGGEQPWLPLLVNNEIAPFPERLPQLHPGALADMAGRYLQAARQGNPAGKLLTDKRPDNFLYIGLIKLLFPTARILYTTRQALDNCLSVYFLHLDHSMGYALDLQHIAHYYLEQQRLMAHWRRLYGDDIHEVNYDSLVREPRTEVTRALRFVGLDWDEGCLKTHESGVAVRTASVWQVREPVYLRSSGRWRNYRRHLAPLAEALGIDMDSLPA